jgi:hypothetical protein
VGYILWGGAAAAMNRNRPANGSKAEAAETSQAT